MKTTYLAGFTVLDGGLVIQFNTINALDVILNTMGGGALKLCFLKFPKIFQHKHRIGNFGQFRFPQICYMIRERFLDPSPAPPFQSILYMDLIET